MYNQSDYPFTYSYPPVIGFGLDGFLIYGRYLKISASGANLALDLCGGHSNAPYGYDYHVSNIDGFWNGISGSNTLSNRDDYPNIQPPCSLTDWFVDPKIKLNIRALQKTSKATPTTKSKTIATTPTTKPTTAKTSATTKPSTTRL